MSLAVIILTCNEERHIARAIDSVSGFASEIHVVDSGSADCTTSIARTKGATVRVNGWVNYATQFQWALDTIETEAEWIMRLDADEVIEPDLAETIRTRLQNLPPEITGVTLDRKHIFMGRWIRHGGRYPLRLLRIFRRGRGRIEQRWMDEHIVLESGRAAHFPGGFADHNLNGLSAFIDKHNAYATREAVDALIARHGLSARDPGVAAEPRSQAGRKRRIKDGAYNRLPFYLAAPAYFLFRYIVQLGFLDGREGLIYHGLQGFWYRFLAGAKRFEFERALADCPTSAEKRARLRALTGLEI